MKEYFVYFAVLVILFSKDSSACFQANSEANRSVTTGSSFYEECCCTDSEYKPMSLWWLDPFNNVISGPGTDSNVYIEEQDQCLALHIPSTSKTLSGAYRCVTTFQGVQYTQTHNLDVFDPLYFYGTATDQYLVHSNNSLIKCQAKGATEPLIRWYRGKDGQNEISNDTVKYQFMPEGLIVKNVTNDDEGVYKCSASVLSTGEEIETDIVAKVMTIPIITQLSASPETVVASGESLMLQCVSEGLPGPEILWKKIPEPIPGQAKNVSWSVESKDTIRFKNITPEDAGTYECHARNFVGVAEKQINITVLIPPTIIAFNDKAVLEGDMVPIICNVTGLPLPNVTITYEGKSFDERKTEYETFIENFSVLKVNRSHDGIYICNATNDVDSVSEMMHLSVLHQPYFDQKEEIVWAWNGETVNVSCAHESNPPANYTWSYITGNFSTIEKQEHDNIVLDYETALEHSFPFSRLFAPFGKHICIARNPFGEASKVFHIKKGFRPSVIENVTTIDQTATSVTFNIEAPTAFEGPEVIGFVAEYDEDKNYAFTDIHPNRTWAVGIPYKLEKLKPNTTYHIKFAAINRVSTGDWTDTYIFLTMDKSAPEPPIFLQDPLEVSASKVLKWKAPESNGEPIDYYVLRYCPQDEEEDPALCKEYRLEETTEMELNDLQQNTTYNLELIAHNAEGNSTPANFSLTMSDGAPNKPASLLSGGALIGISIVVVLLCLVLLDVLLYFWKKQGIIASCFCKKSKKRKPNPLNARDKKGLLKDNGESGTDDTLKRPNNGHKEYEYNKTTGIITGKHSSV
nr:fasciclin-2 isoform X1 [Helicoverpa armigera]